MITLYTGTPGSGKSYHMAKLIHLLYKKGKYIFANFDIDVDYLSKKYPKSKSQVFCIDNRDLKYPFGLTGFSNNFHVRESINRVKESQSYLFIDECNNNFDSRFWNEKGRKDWNHWLSEHRKDGFEVILTTQDIGDIDKKIRKRLEIEVKHFDVKNFTVFGKILALMLGGHLFIQRSQWCSKGNTKNLKISTDFLLCRKKYYRLFDTSQHFMHSLDTNLVWQIRAN